MKMKSTTRTTTIRRPMNMAFAGRSSSKMRLACAIRARPAVVVREICSRVRIQFSLRPGQAYSRRPLVGEIPIENRLFQFEAKLAPLEVADDEQSKVFLWQ